MRASYKIWQPRQGNRRVRLYLAPFKFLVADANWNKAALIDQFRQGPHNNIWTELVRQGVPWNLGQLYQLARFHLEEMQLELVQSNKPSPRSYFVRFLLSCHSQLIWKRERSIVGREEGSSGKLVLSHREPQEK